MQTYKDNLKNRFFKQFSVHTHTDSARVLALSTLTPALTCCASIFKLVFHSFISTSSFIAPLIFRCVLRPGTAARAVPSCSQRALLSAKRINHFTHFKKDGRGAGSELASHFLSCTNHSAIELPASCLLACASLSARDCKTSFRLVDEFLKEGTSYTHIYTRSGFSTSTSTPFSLPLSLCRYSLHRLVPLFKALPIILVSR